VSHIQLPFPSMLPESSWRIPTSFPDLRGRGAKKIVFDCETRDPKLHSNGPGFIRGDAYVAGVAISDGDKFHEYYPVAHAQGQNLPKNLVFDWLRDQLGGEEEKVTANGLYDLEALYYSGIHRIGGKIRDIQIAEPLLNEETAEGYSLEVLSNKYLGVGKNEELLRQASSLYKIDGKTFNPKSDMWALPAAFVGPYAIGDVLQTNGVFEKQKPLIEKDRLSEIFELETNLVPILLQMRVQGVRVDVEGAYALSKRLGKEIDQLALEIMKLTGFDLNVNSGPDLCKAYTKIGIDTPVTARGNPSITKDWLARQSDPLSKLIAQKRKMMTMKSNFVDGDILSENVRGRVHSQFHSLRQDTQGTRSGRFSSTNPNLQQVPARDEFWAPLIRSLFLADEGALFFKGDYSQQEPRLTVHFAYKAGQKGAEIAVKEFLANPRTDYHSMTTRIVNETSGKNFARKQIKGVNLGIVYGMGLDKLCKQLGVSHTEGKSILEAYHAALPFVKGLSSLCMQVADTRGNIRTILGRLRRFDLWEPVVSYNEYDSGMIRPLPQEQARAKWPNMKIRRAGLSKALNALVQGSAADQTKKAMSVLYYEYGKIPQMQVHDELCASVASMEEASLFKRVMENAVQLCIPVVCDGSVGRSWGEAKTEVA